MADTAEVFSLLYLSEGTVPFSRKDLRDLLKKSREANSQVGVTGMLLFKGGNFLQVLEGEKDTVLGLYQRIAQDPRHNKVKILFQGTSTRRDFPDWSMGFHDLDSPETRDIPGFNGFLNRPITCEEFVDARRAKRLFLLFKEEKLLGSTHCLIQGVAGKSNGPSASKARLGSRNTFDR